MPDLTPQALHALSLRVPVEARPEWVILRCGRWWADIYDEESHFIRNNPCSLAHAILLHEAAAMRWLAGGGYIPLVDHEYDDCERADVWSVAVNEQPSFTPGVDPKTLYTGPTPYEALVAAIEGLATPPAVDAG